MMNELENKQICAELDSLLTRAVKERAEKFLEIVETKCKEILSQNPDWHLPHYYLGLIYHRKGDFNTAKQCFSNYAVIKKSVDNTVDITVLRLLADTSFKQGEIVEANNWLNYCKDFVKKSCNRVFADVHPRIITDFFMNICEMSDLYIELQKAKEAIECLELIKTKYYDHPMVNYRLGTIYQCLNLSEKASEIFRKVLKDDFIKNVDFELETRLNLGICYMDMNQSDLAQEQLELIEKSKNKQLPTYHFLKGLILKSQKPLESIIEFEKVAELGNLSYEITIPQYHDLNEISLTTHTGYKTQAFAHLGDIYLFLSKQELGTNMFIEDKDLKITALKYFLKAIKENPLFTKPFYKIRSIIYEELLEKSDFEVFKLIQPIFQEDKTLGEQSYIFVDLFLSKKDKVISKNILDALLSLIIKDEDIDKTLKPIEREGMHPVYFSSSGPLTSEVFIIKTYNIEDNLTTENLKREFLINKFVWDIFKQDYIETESTQEGELISSEKIKIIEPISFHTHKNGKNYLITKREKLPTLSDIIQNSNEKNVTKEIKAAIYTLSRLHGLVTPRIKIKNSKYYIEAEHERQKQELEISIYDFKEEFLTRLIKNKKYDQSPRLESLVENIGSKSVKEFVYQYEQVIEEIRNAPRFFIHQDAHLGNFLKGGIILDFEKASMGNPMLDVSLVTQEINQELAMRDLLKGYANLIKQYTIPGIEMITERSLQNQFRICRLQNTFCGLGHALSKNMKDVVFAHLNYLSNILSEFPILKESFIKMINENINKVNSYFQ